MAKLTKEEFINSLNEMSILEIKELVDAIDRKSVGRERVSSVV